MLRSILEDHGLWNAFWNDVRAGKWTWCLELEIKRAHIIHGHWQVSKELWKYYLDLVIIQEAGLEKRGAKMNILPVCKRNQNDQLLTGFLQKSIISAVQKVEFFSDKMTSSVLRCYSVITVLNAHKNEGWSRYSKDSFIKEFSWYFIASLSRARKLS